MNLHKNNAEFDWVLAFDINNGKIWDFISSPFNVIKSIHLGDSILV